MSFFSLSSVVILILMQCPGATGIRNQRRLVGHIGGVIVAVGSGLIAGYLVGMGAMGSHTHAMWPALAGFVVGMAGSLAVSRRQVLVAFGGGCIAVVSAVVTIVLIQVLRGRWPITEGLTLVHYGSAPQATARAALVYSVLIGLPCLMTAALVALARHRAAHRITGAR